MKRACALVLQAKDAIEHGGEQRETLNMLQEAAELLQKGKAAGDIRGCRDLLAPTLKSLMPVDEWEQVDEREDAA
jgi:hypothetical protein